MADFSRKTTPTLTYRWRNLLSCPNCHRSGLDVAPFDHADRSGGSGNLIRAVRSLSSLDAHLRCNPRTVSGLQLFGGIIKHHGRDVGARVIRNLLTFCVQACGAVLVTEGFFAGVVGGFASLRDVKLISSRIPIKRDRFAFGIAGGVYDPGSMLGLSFILDPRTQHTNGLRPYRTAPPPQQARLQR